MNRNLEASSKFYETIGMVTNENYPIEYIADYSGKCLVDRTNVDYKNLDTIYHSNDTDP